MTEVISNYNNNHFVQNQDFDADRKLFVGGLTWDITEKDLLDYFSQYGSILNVKIKYNFQTGNSRGFGFITFASDGSINAVLDNVPHLLKNKQIDLRKAISRPIFKKIFVGGVCSNLSEPEIISYFSKFGNIEGIELPFDRTRNRRREFCFIIFENQESAYKACMNSKQSLGGREVEIKRAQLNYQHQDRRNYRNDSYNRDNKPFNYNFRNMNDNRKYQYPTNMDSDSNCLKGYFNEFKN